MDQQFETDLESWLHATADRYVVDRTLKETATESTQVVYRRDEQGNPTIGPFVRKCFAHGASQGNAYEQILRAQTAGDRLAHQPIVYECDRVQNRLEVVMEFIPGKTLRELAHGSAPATLRSAGLTLVRDVFLPLCDAVSELHEHWEQPLIHRDIKPSNVMVDGERIVLIDLGIARTYNADATHDTVRYGTPGYAPPEQFGYGQTSVRSDVYALGMTLAFCLTGEDPTPDLRERGFVDRRIPPELRPVLAQATQFDPQARFESASDLQAACSAALEELPAARQQHSPRAPGSPPAPTPSGSRASHILGRLWNVALLLSWAFVMAAFAYAPFNPDNENLKNYSMGAFALISFGALMIPTTLIVYLLLDRRRLRAWEPLSRYTWRQEVPFCLGLAALSVIFTILVYLILSKIFGI